MKDKKLGPLVTNFRPITCLLLMWKLLTGILAEEKKGCRKNSRGTKDQLVIDKMIIKICMRRLIGLGRAWIDFKNAFDRVPHSWMVHCMTIFVVAEHVTKLFQSSIERWKTEMMAGGKVF